MVSTYYRDLKRILLDHGCTYVRQGKGDHEIWHSPISDRHFSEYAMQAQKHISMCFIALGFAHEGLPPLRRDGSG